MTNNTLKAISERFSCRAFTDRVPEQSDLDAIALAAVEAPSGQNRQGWQFIVVRNRELIGEMDREGLRVLSRMGNRAMIERIESRGGKLFYNAPCVIVIAVKEALPKGAELIDCGIAAQNIVLAATSLGIASLHCGFVACAFAGDRAADFKQRLKFPPGYECGMGVLLGYAERVSAPHAPDLSKISYVD